eukprot:11544411-Alexandrium_andersonii.AAC.1
MPRRRGLATSLSILLRPSSLLVARWGRDCVVHSRSRRTWAFWGGAGAVGVIERFVAYRFLAFAYIWLAVGRGLS